MRMSRNSASRVALGLAGFLAVGFGGCVASNAPYNYYTHKGERNVLIRGLPMEDGSTLYQFPQDFNTQGKVKKTLMETFPYRSFPRNPDGSIKDVLYMRELPSGEAIIKFR